MDLACGTSLAHYRLLERIGEGGMGVVWKALDARLDRTIALKFLHAAVAADPGRVALFDREARALAALQHPNIVTIYSVEEYEDLRFIAMEYVQGSPLGRIVPDAGLSLPDFFEVALPLTDAVRAAHTHGIAHRDLKPANILVTADRGLKVLDFGVAKFLEPAASAGRTTRVDTHEEHIEGTPAFMAPEVIRGGQAGARTDLFSLGGLFYLMLTGREPFPGDTIAEVFAAVLRDTPIPIAVLRPEVPTSLIVVVDRCLAKDPEARFEDASPLYEALSRARHDVSVRERHVRSVGVLPFDDLSAEKDQDYFCEGIAEEIILALTRIDGLRVASRSAAFLARATIPNRQDLGSRLGVETLLEGSVRKSGRRLRISVELTDATSGYNLWTERYDREEQDVFEIQDEIASRVTEALRGALTEHEQRAMRERPTLQVEAYDYYLRGRKFLYQYSRKGMEFALEMFARALELDPRYARALAGSAECHAFRYLYAGAHDEDRERADAESARAVALSPESAEAHSARGVALSLGQQHAEAEAEFQQALRLNPELFDAHYFSARTSFALGRFEQAIERWEKASEVRPEDYQAPLLVAQAYEQLGRHAEAMRSRRRGVTVAQEHLRRHPDDIRALYMGANGLVALGETEKGLAWARHALTLDPEEPMLLYNIGCIYALAGMADGALDCLERSVASGLRQREWFQHDTNLDSLRSSPRFVHLMAELESVTPTSTGK